MDTSTIARKILALEISGQIVIEPFANTWAAKVHMVAGRLERAFLKHEGLGYRIDQFRLGSYYEFGSTAPNSPRPVGRCDSIYVGRVLLTLVDVKEVPTPARQKLVPSAQDSARDKRLAEIEQELADAKTLIENEGYKASLPAPLDAVAEAARVAFVSELRDQLAAQTTHIEHVQAQLNEQITKTKQVELKFRDIKRTYHRIERRVTSTALKDFVMPESIQIEIEALRVACDGKVYGAQNNDTDRRTQKAEATESVCLSENAGA